MGGPEDREQVNQRSGGHLEELVHAQPVNASPLSLHGLQEALHEQEL